MDPVNARAPAPADQRVKRFRKARQLLDREVQLDTELVPGQVEMRPGECFQLTLPVRVTRPRLLDLSQIIVQVAKAGGESKDDRALSPRREDLDVLPAIARDIDIQVEPLCAYGNSTKVHLTIDHKGTTAFKDLVLTLGPERAIHAGKCIFRFSTFNPGQCEQAELVAESDTLEVTMKAFVVGMATSAQLTLPIRRPPLRSEREHFRFLEPRRLSADEKKLYHGSGEDRRLVDPVHAAYPLQSGEQYVLEITPPDSAVTDIQLEEIKGVVNLRTKDRSPDGRSWRFVLDVTATGLFSKAERLFYNVIRPDETLKGEVHLRLKPERGRHLRLASALGVAVTLQGFGVLFKFLANADYSLEEAMAHFHFGSDYQLLFPLCIPLFWGALCVYDLVQYRVRA